MLNARLSESRRLERIVADMLSVSEIEAGTLKIVRGDVRLDQLFEELKDDYRVQAEDKEIAMVFNRRPSCLWCMWTARSMPSRCTTSSAMCSSTHQRAGGDDPSRRNCR